MKKIKIQKKYLIPAIIVLLIAALAVTAVVTTNHYLNKINRVGDDVDIVAPEDEDFETDENTGLEELDPEEVEWTAAESLGDEKLINILLVGQDRRPGEGRQRSDAMIVVSINQENKKISMISFLRDLYVQIPGYSDNRLNAAYVFGGFPLLKSALNTNFGITIDGCFEVDFNGFMALIDQIGGVDIYLTAAECERIGKKTHEGMNHLDGRSALAYARIRKIGTDFARTNRQRTVLLAAFDVVKQKSLTELLRLLDNALPYLTTDMSNTEIYSLATKLFPLISSVKINSYYIPPDGMYSNVYIRQMDVLYPNLSAIRNILKTEYLPF